MLMVYHNGQIGTGTIHKIVQLINNMVAGYQAKFSLVI